MTESERKIAKQSETSFRFKFYDKDTDTSVVKCKPKTGRTHQIRVHLKYLGHPIYNDACYGGRLFNGLKINPKDFENAYENHEDGGNKLFMRLWLHAYKYRLKELTVKTTLPTWATPEFTFDPSEKDF